MAKIKTCKYLDSSIMGSVIFINRHCDLCYDRGISIANIDDYRNIDVDEIIKNITK